MYNRDIIIGKLKVNILLICSSKFPAFAFIKHTNHILFILS